MGARQHAGADADGPHGLGVATVDARLAGQDAPRTIFFSSFSQAA
jgi:hypothetical protein